MVYRDPNTGQFVSDNGSHGQYNDIEQWTFNGSIRFDGEDENDFSERVLDIVDIDDITDRRREAADLLYAHITVSPSTTEATGGAMGYYLQLQSGGTGLDPRLTTTETAAGQGTDSLDAIGAPFVQRTGRAADGNDMDVQVLELDMDKVGDPTFHPRNEIQMVGELENKSGDGQSNLKVNVSGQFVFGLKDAGETGR